MERERKEPSGSSINSDDNLTWVAQIHQLPLDKNRWHLAPKALEQEDRELHCLATLSLSRARV